MAKRENGYHRADLRGELLGAARQFVNLEGHEDLSVRKLAQLVGVSPGAPYHHFPDRRALLLAVALEGYREMTALGQLASQSDLASDQRLFTICEMFLKFAADNPRLFSLMYESELTRPFLDPAIANAQLTGLEILRSAVLPVAGETSPDKLGVKIATLWSAVYVCRAKVRSHRLLTTMLRS